MQARPDRLPTVTVVIPALNEEHIIGRCLDALHASDQLPDEIVLVDNGSTDGTARIAEGYPLVRVVREDRPGITFARTTGFDAAEGDIIARIDADTIVHRTWTRTMRETFARHPEWHAITGSAAIAELSPRGRFWFAFWYRGFRWWHERSIGVSPMLYGFNGAIRKQAWQQAHGEIAMDDMQVSEDVDVTIALLRTGHELRYVPELRVKARLFRSFDREKLARYYRTDGLTLARHQYGNVKRWVSE